MDINDAMTKKELNIGFIGFGLAGQRRFNIVSSLSFANPIAICDLKPLQQNNYNVYESYEDLILKENVDVLFVAVSNSLAAQITKLAIKNNIHVFCEKPPAITQEDTLEIIELLKERPHVKVQYGFNHRYHQSIQTLKNFIQDKRFGNLLNIKATYGKSNLGPSNSWREIKELSGGGILIDQGMHMIDIIAFLAGPISEVKSFISNSHYKKNIEDNVFALLRSSTGALSFLHSSGTLWKHKFSIELNFDEAIVNLLGFLTHSKSYGPEVLKIQSKQDSQTLKEEILTFNEENSWSDEVQEFFNSILNNSSVVNGNIEIAQTNLKLVHDIYQNDSSWTMYRI